MDNKEVRRQLLVVYAVVALLALTASIFAILGLTVTKVIVVDIAVKGESHGTMEYGLFRACGIPDEGPSECADIKDAEHNDDNSGGLIAPVTDNEWDALQKVRYLTIAAGVAALVLLAAALSARTQLGKRDFHGHAPAVGVALFFGLVAAACAAGSAYELSTLLDAFNDFFGPAESEGVSVKYGTVGLLLFAAAGALGLAFLLCAWSRYAVSGMGEFDALFAEQPSGVPLLDVRGGGGHAGGGNLHAHAGAVGQQYFPMQQHVQGGYMMQPGQYYAGGMPPAQQQQQPQGSAPMTQSGQYYAGGMPPAQQQQQPQGSAPMTQPGQYYASGMPPAQQQQPPQGGGPMTQPGPYATLAFNTAQMSNAGAEPAAPASSPAPPAAAAAPALPETVHDDGL